MTSHTPPLSSVLGRPLALLERCLRAPTNNFDPSDSTRYGYGVYEYGGIEYYGYELLKSSRTFRPPVWVY